MLLSNVNQIEYFTQILQKYTFKNMNANVKRIKIYNSKVRLKLASFISLVRLTELPSNQWNYKLNPSLYIFKSYFQFR